MSNPSVSKLAFTNPTYELRKSPVQARSTATVAAITEATIQVLLVAGLDRLTTNRVAERAGVSIGTLYQYYPNKQALLSALLEDCLCKSSEAMEQACSKARGKPLSDMIRDVVLCFVDAKMARTDISVALYQISTNIGGPEIVKRMVLRCEKALGTMIESASGTAQPYDPFAIKLMFSAMSGATRTVLEAGASPALVSKLKDNLVLLCQVYMEAATSYNSPLPFSRTTNRHTITGAEAQMKATS